MAFFILQVKFVTKTGNIMYSSRCLTWICLILTVFLGRYKQTNNQKTSQHNLQFLQIFSCQPLFREEFRLVNINGVYLGLEQVF